MPQISYAIVGVIFGLIFGSAINAMVWRLKVGRSWVKGRSVCPDCGHTLAARDLVPVVSWLLLGGKCRYCRKPIKDHPIVELVTAVAFGLSAYALYPATSAGWIKLLLWLVLLVMLLVLAIYDARWMLLPDKVMIPLLLLALAYAAVMAVVNRSPQMLIHALVTAVLVGGAFYGVVFVSKGRAMGGGDIKLAAAMGLILGPRATAVAMLLAFNSAAIIGVVLMLAHRKGRRDQIAFGPFLVAGAIVAFLYGQQIVTWYLRINGLY
jgi:prepilin signal peptidase PulO-like enzyme (type II secretory pathway)